MEIINTKTITDINLFDFMSCFFCDTKKYNNLTNKAKSKHIFMFYRFMSIMYPIQMHKYNRVHDVRIIDSLQKIFSKNVKKPPSWLYTKTDKEKAKKESEKLDYEDEVIDHFKQYYSLEPKSFDFILEFDREFTISELNKIKNELENKVSKKTKK